MGFKITQFYKIGISQTDFGLALEVPKTMVLFDATLKTIGRQLEVAMAWSVPLTLLTQASCILNFTMVILVFRMMLVIVGVILPQTVKVSGFTYQIDQNSPNRIVIGYESSL